MDDSGSPPGGDFNRGNALITIAIVLGAISTITTSIRITVRSIKRQLGWDDCAITLATVLLVIQVIFNGLEWREGAGRHAYYLSTQQKRRGLKWIYVTHFFFYLIVCLTKIGICLFVLRIKNTGWVKWCLYTLMGGLVLTTIPCVVILSAQCRPLHAFWEGKAGGCWPLDIYNNAVWAQVAYSILSDLVCSLLPMVVLWKVKVSRHLKWAVCGLMSIGLLATGFAAVRASLLGNYVLEDLTWSLTEISIFGVLEENFGIIGANLAMSRAVYLFIRERGDAGGSPGVKRNRWWSQPSWRRLLPSTGWHNDTRSQESVIPLEGQMIRKTTDLVVTRAPRTKQNGGISDAVFEGRTFFVEDKL